MATFTMYRCDVCGVTSDQKTEFQRMTFPTGDAYTHSPEWLICDLGDCFTATTYDVIAVELGSKRVTVIKERLETRPWERHLTDRFYTTAEAGKYRDGDTYGGAK